MSFKFFIIFALFCVVESKATSKQLLPIRSAQPEKQQDEPLENATESPLNVGNIENESNLNNTNKTDIKKTNPSELPDLVRINSKRAQFPEERNATNVNPDLRTQKERIRKLRRQQSLRKQKQQKLRQRRKKQNQQKKNSNKSRNKNQRNDQRKGQQQQKG